MPVQFWQAEPQGLFTAPGRIANPRDSLILGAYVPSPATTGVPPNATLEYRGTWSSTADNQVVTGVRFGGMVTLRHAGPIFRNCIFEYGPPVPDPGTTADTKPLVSAFHPNVVDAQFYDCEFYPTVRSVFAAIGLQGRRFAAYRCRFHGTVDGLQVMYSDGIVRACLLDDFPHYDADPWQTNGSHNDAIQCEGGGGGFDFSYNAIFMGEKTTSGIIVTQNLGVVTGLLIHHNWIISTHTGPQSERAGVGINLTQKTLGAMSGVVITDNRISAPSTWKANTCALIDYPTYDAATITGNREVLFDDAGWPRVEASSTPAKITRNLDIQ